MSLTTAIPHAPAVVCALDGRADRHTAAFAGELARRLEWRLALVPLGPEASGERRRSHLVAAAEREAGRVIVVPATGPGAHLADRQARLALSRASGLPVLSIGVSAVEQAPARAA